MAGDTLAAPVITRDTVAVETEALCATSRIPMLYSLMLNTLTYNPSAFLFSISTNVLVVRNRHSPVAPPCVPDAHFGDVRFNFGFAPDARRVSDKFWAMRNCFHRSVSRGV